MIGRLMLQIYAATMGSRDRCQVSGVRDARICASLRQKGYSHDQDRYTIGRMASSAAQTVRSHRDLVVWQRAIDLVECAYRISRRFPADERFGLTSQLRRAAVSVPSNIAEGHGRTPLAEYLHHLSIAKGS